MMTHEACRDLLSAWIDGELRGAQAEEIRAHLAGCAACGAHLAALERVSRQLRALPHEAMPAELKAEILRAARRTSTSPRRAVWRWTFAASSLAAAAAIVLIAVVLRQNEPGLPLPQSKEADRLAASVPADDNEIVLNKQAAVTLEKKAAEGSTSDLPKTKAAPAAALPPMPISGLADKDERTLGAGKAGRDNARNAAELVDERQYAPEPAPAEPRAEQERALPPMRYAAVISESAGAFTLRTDLTLLPPAQLASRQDAAAKNSGLKSTADEEAGARERRVQAQSAAPSAAAGGAPQPSLDGGMLQESSRPLELIAQVDALGMIQELTPAAGMSIDVARLERIRALLAGRVLSGLPPGARTAIIELTVQKAP